ncbi:MAG: DNA polymerase III subunit delta [Bacteroidetes bacterium]|jgi:DNA polymerase-3 subunit delta|nr:DNA polymerase III subunit delta [Bacteroidota bacterium]
MNAHDILADLKNKKYRSIYFLTGEEPYFIDLIANYILENVLSESEKSFNQTVLYGKDTDAVTVVNAARRFPMMAEYQVVMVKEAQNLKNIDELIHYTEKPLKSTILVINHKYKKLDKRKKLYKSIQQNGVLFESNKLYEDKVPAWIDTFLKSKGYTIEPKAGLLLVEFLGNDLGKIANELEKLIITIPPEVKKITPLHIEQNIGISKDYNNLELQKAMTENNWLKACQIVDYFSKNTKNNPFILTVTSLYFYFSKILLYHFTADKSPRNIAAVLKINPYFVNDYKKAAQRYIPKKAVQVISLLREYDLKSKGVGNTSTPDGDLLKELIYKIMH